MRYQAHLMKIVECPETMSQCIAGKGHTYWNESDIKDGKWVVLPTMRVARLHHVTDCGRKVFVTPAGKLVCEHGECASSIGSWVLQNKLRSVWASSHFHATSATARTPTACTGARRCRRQLYRSTRLRTRCLGC